jgi:hypothetical protein
VVAVRGASVVSRSRELNSAIVAVLFTNPPKTAEM